MKPTSASKFSRQRVDMNAVRNAYLVLSLATALTGGSIAQASEILPSWNDGKSKQSIIDFVTKVTKGRVS
jgi:hypothetical protein